jgi:hypothetical protein
MGFTHNRLHKKFGSYLKKKKKKKKKKKNPQPMGFTPTSLLQNFGSDEKYINK